MKSTLTEFKGKHLYQAHLRHLQSTQTLTKQRTLGNWLRSFPTALCPLSPGTSLLQEKHLHSSVTAHTFKALLVGVGLGNRAVTESISSIKEKKYALTTQNNKASKGYKTMGKS